jgi:superfamily II DNA or RNA helicase
MDEVFISNHLLQLGPWQALERAVARLMQHGRYNNVRLVGRTGDGGADILASFGDKRYLVQVKFRRSIPVDSSVVDETLAAMKRYRADFPIIATNTFAADSLINRQKQLQASGINLTLWGKSELKDLIANLQTEGSKKKNPRDYQINPINNIIDAYNSDSTRKGYVVMATGLGKTFVVSEALRRIAKGEGRSVNKILILAHTNELVYQLEKSFWFSLTKNQTTAVWNGNEKGDVENSFITFGCVDTILNQIDLFGCLPISYDLLIIDEAHHAGSLSYQKIIESMEAGTVNGPFLLGLTATPWRADEKDISNIFENQLCCVDMIEGMGKGYLSNIDYRMHVDNIDWDNLTKIKKLTPKALNKTLFIKEWDDAVIDELQKAWNEVYQPKAIVFCSTIEHALMVRDKINARRFTRAESIYSGSFNGRKMDTIDRSKLLCDFADGLVGIVCAVDIFNEGIDVPDVNILVFQRVTHSRRIFVQQLGRGLRISEDKDKVIVLDFVTDIRRFAAGLELKEKLSTYPKYIRLGSPVKFINKSKEDTNAENFLKEWLKDVASIQDAGEDDHVLKYPPVDLLEK